MQSVVVFGTCHLIEEFETVDLLKKFAMKYYPNEQLVEGKIAHAGSPVGKVIRLNNQNHLLDFVVQYGKMVEMEKKLQRKERQLCTIS